MRKEYIERQKGENDRKVVVTLPIFFPKEILTAMNILSVEIWGPPGNPAGSDVGRIQTYVCPIVRNAMAFLASGKAQVADGVLFPHTCDSIQGLATVLPDLGDWDMPVFHFIHPKGERRASTEKYIKKEIQKLADNLATLTGDPLDWQKLKWAITLHRDIDRLRIKLIRQRSKLDMTDMELFTLLRRGEWLWPEDHLAELQEAEKKIADKQVQNGLPIMISGIVPEPMSIYEHINEAGAYIVADDFASIGRRAINYEVSDNSDPIDMMVELYFAAPPCSTRASLVDFRRDYLLAMARETGAKGLIIHNIKFCEPELFDVPHIRKSFGKENIPVLYMEGELEAELSGQTITRLEAFIEMAAKGRG